MFAIITGYNEATGSGIIQDSKGNAYLFDSSSWQDDCAPRKGMSVYFELNKLGQIQGYTHYVVQVLPRFSYGT